MNLFKLKWVYLALIILPFFTSCSDDLAEDVEISELRDGRNNDRPDGQGDNNDGPNRGNDELDVVIEWSELFAEIDQHAYGMRPNATARAIAYINLAAYEVGASASRSLTSESTRLEGLDIDEDAPRDLDVEEALNACYATVLDHFMINVDTDIKAKIQELESSMSENARRNDGQNGNNNDEEESAEWGTYIAEQVIAYALTDTEAENQIPEPQPLSYEPPTGDGYWTYSADPERALFPYWGQVRTFVISSEETTSVPPMEYSTNPTSGYYQQMEEVYNDNNAAREEQGEDLWIAEFWSDDVEGLMVSPPGRQVAIAAQLMENERMSLESGLELMLKLGYALNDAAVSTWADKYEYMVMRPNVFIHEYIDPDFQTNLFRLVYWPNPSFPGYPSGHSTFASAAGGVFIDTFGDIPFTDYTHEGREEFLGEPRSFTSISQMAEENAYSRIPLGVHIRMDCDEGLRLGYEISDAVNALDVRSNAQ